MEPNSTAPRIDLSDPNARAQAQHQHISLHHGPPLFLGKNQVTYSDPQAMIWNPTGQLPNESIFSHQHQHYLGGCNDQPTQPPQGSGTMGAQSSQAMDLSAQFESLAVGPIGTSNGQPYNQPVPINNPQPEEPKKLFEQIRGTDASSQPLDFYTPAKKKPSGVGPPDKVRTLPQANRNMLSMPIQAIPSGMSSNERSKEIPQNRQSHTNPRRMSDQNSMQSPGTLLSDNVNYLHYVADVVSDISKQEQIENRNGIFDSSYTSDSHQPEGIPTETDCRTSMSDLEDVQRSSIQLHRGSNSLGRVEQEANKLLSNSGAMQNREWVESSPYTYQPNYMQFGVQGQAQIGPGFNPQYMIGNQEITRDLQNLQDNQHQIRLQTQNPHFAQAQAPSYHPGQFVYVMHAYPAPMDRKVSSDNGFPQQQFNQPFYDPHHQIPQQSMPTQVPPRNKNNSFGGRPRPGPFGSHGNSSNRSANSHTMTSSTQQSYESFFIRIQRDLKEAEGNSEKQAKILRHNVHRLAKQKVGSRHLQDMLPKSDEQLIHALVEEVKEDLVNLINDQYGNYFVSKLVQYMKAPQRIDVLKLIQSNDFLNIAFNGQGAYTLQNLIKQLEDDREFAQIIEKLGQNGVLRLAKNQVGHNVLEVIITTFLEQNRPEFKQIFDQICHEFYQIATAQHGLCVLKKMLAHLIHFPNKAYQKRLVAKVSERALDYIQSEFGNFIVSEIVRLPFDQTQSIYYQIQDHITELSKGKFSSKVIEKCIEKAPVDFQTTLVQELISCDSRNLARVAEDQFGNYVLQKSIVQQQDKNYPIPGYVACPETAFQLINAVIHSIQFFQKSQIWEKWGSKIIPDAISVLQIPQHRTQELHDSLQHVMKQMREKERQRAQTSSDGSRQDRKPRSEQNFRGKYANGEKKRNYNQKKRN